MKFLIQSPSHTLYACLAWAMAICCMATSCGQSYEQSVEQQPQARMAEERADSAALKVAVMPTIDCVPAWVARELHLLDSIGAEVKLKVYSAQMDCDTALARGHVEGMFTDIVRAQMLRRQGSPLHFMATTTAQWQLTTTRNAGITQLRQLDDKMVAMARHSATDMLCDKAVAKAMLRPERVYRVQVNDVALRLQMIMVNTIDAAMLPEPQATIARLAGHHQLHSQEAGNGLGALVFSAKAMANGERKRQIDAFVKAYQQACDSIDANGLATYRHIIAQCCNISPAAVDSLPSNFKFANYAPPSASSLQMADQWIDQALKWMDE